jgi:hypothetical protein
MGLSYATMPAEQEKVKVEVKWGSVKMMTRLKSGNSGLHSTSTF